MSTREEDTVSAVIARLQQSPYRRVRHLSCRMTEGALVLHGRVATYYEKQLAQETVRNIRGIRQIVNKISVSSRK
jgi:osmotically-inducible protein OsmY